MDFVFVCPPKNSVFSVVKKGLFSFWRKPVGNPLDKSMERSVEKYYHYASVEKYNISPNSPTDPSTAVFLCFQALIDLSPKYTVTTLPTTIFYL